MEKRLEDLHSNANALSQSMLEIISAETKLDKLLGERRNRARLLQERTAIMQKCLTTPVYASGNEEIAPEELDASLMQPPPLSITIWRIFGRCLYESMECQLFRLDIKTHLPTVTDANGALLKPGSYYFVQEAPALVGTTDFNLYEVHKNKVFTRFYSCYCVPFHGFHSHVPISMPCS